MFCFKVVENKIETSREKKKSQKITSTVKNVQGLTVPHQITLVGGIVRVGGVLFVTQSPVVGAGAFKGLGTPTRNPRS